MENFVGLLGKRIALQESDIKDITHKRSDLQNFTRDKVIIYCKNDYASFIGLMQGKEHGLNTEQLRFLIDVIDIGIKTYPDIINIQKYIKNWNKGIDFLQCNEEIKISLKGLMDVLEIYNNIKALDTEKTISLLDDLRKYIKTHWNIKYFQENLNDITERIQIITNKLIEESKKNLNNIDANVLAEEILKAAVLRRLLSDQESERFQEYLAAAFDAVKQGLERNRKRGMRIAAASGSALLVCAVIGAIALTIGAITLPVGIAIIGPAIVIGGAGAICGTLYAKENNLTPERVAEVLGKEFPGFQNKLMKEKFPKDSNSKGR